MGNQYNSKDGLKVLEYLGIRNITEEEKKVFEEKWDGVYKMRQDFIMTVWTLYSEVLPFNFGDKDHGSFALAQLRDEDFGKRLDKTELDKELKQGIPLDEILKKGPHKFIKQVPEDDFLNGKVDPYSVD